MGEISKISKFGEGITSALEKKAEMEKVHIINKVKSLLNERGATMWESLLSC